MAKGSSPHNLPDDFPGTERREPEIPSQLDGSEGAPSERRSNQHSIRKALELSLAAAGSAGSTGAVVLCEEALRDLDNLEEQFEALNKWLRDSAVRAAKNKGEASGEGHTYWQGYENACLDAEIIRDSNPREQSWRLN